MKMSAKQLKALEWFIREKSLKPLLSTPPKMYLRNSDGEQVDYDLNGIVLEYEAWNEEDKKERAREKRVKDTRRIIKSGF